MKPFRRTSILREWRHSVEIRWIARTQARAGGPRVSRVGRSAFAQRGVCIGQRATRSGNSATKTGVPASGEAIDESTTHRSHDGSFPCSSSPGVVPSCDRNLLAVSARAHEFRTPDRHAIRCMALAARVIERACARSDPHPSRGRTRQRTARMCGNGTPLHRTPMRPRVTHVSSKEINFQDRCQFAETPGSTFPPLTITPTRAPRTGISMHSPRPTRPRKPQTARRLDHDPHPFEAQAHRLDQVRVGHREHPVDVRQHQRERPPPEGGRPRPVGDGLGIRRRVQQRPDRNSASRRPPPRAPRPPPRTRATSPAPRSRTPRAAPRPRSRRTARPARPPPRTTPSRMSPAPRSRPGGRRAARPSARAPRDLTAQRLPCDLRPVVLDDLTGRLAQVPPRRPLLHLRRVTLA